MVTAAARRTFRAYGRLGNDTGPQRIVEPSPASADGTFKKSKRPAAHLEDFCLSIEVVDCLLLGLTVELHKRPTCHRCSHFPTSPLHTQEQTVARRNPVSPLGVVCRPRKFGNAGIGRNFSRLRAGRTTTGQRRSFVDSEMKRIPVGTTLRDALHCGS